ncbi:hypothetical protein [Actinoplanes rectilineatus]|uniref:hypothetical protein n=1 Tax=Actinoplanes rectilineatus TaxID=113571 RepID=UPI0005F2920E|nr:hypothetical protein [Actinoplanes rectilineatus]
MESSLVTMIGLVLGGFAAGGTLPAALSTTGAVSGAAALDLPWLLIATVVLVGFLITGTAGVLTTWSATLGRPVAVLAARE